MIVALGDLMLDLVVQTPCSAPRGGHCSVQARISPGGSAANFAVWAARLGAEAALIAKVGDDVLGHALLDDLRREGVLSAVAVGHEATGFTLATVAPDGQRTMLAARGATATLSPADLDWTLLDRADWLHVTAYAFLEEAPRAAAQAAMQYVKKRGRPVSLDPASSSYLQGIGPEAFFALAEGADILFPNWDEGRALTGEEEPERIVRQLVKRFPLVALKLGSTGAIAATEERLVHEPSLAEQVVDTVGAGDAFAAAFVVTWMVRHDLAAALHEANRLAASVVQGGSARAAPRVS